MGFAGPGFVDHHTHLLRVSAGAPPPWADEGLAAFHRRIAAAGSTPMDEPLELPPTADLATRLRDGLLRARSLGLCQITEAGMGDWSELDALLQLRDAGDLPVGVRVLVASGLADRSGGAAAVAARRTGDPQVEVEGVKLYADGWLGPRTCALCWPFADGAGDDRGVLFLDGAAVARRAAPFAEAGLVVATHAIGDRAIEAVLAGYEAAFGGDGAALAAAGWRIEHCQVTRPDLVAGLAELGVVACIQPGFGPSDWEAAAVGLGARTADAYDWPGLLAAGVPVLSGSDFPIESLDPLSGLCDLVTGRATGAPTLDVARAFALMTDAAAGTTLLTEDPRASPGLLGLVGEEGIRVLGVTRPGETT
jgi:predicted amidohydrolase YtcJ